MKLYANEISSATSRVRIALAMKGVQVDIVNVGILGDGAENRQADYLGINPQGLVPALQTDDGELLTQSLAIVEYLDERFPLPPLLPKDGAGRAFSRSIALAIASEIHALVPPRVAAHLARIPGMGATGVVAWNRHWILEGLGAVEARLAARRTGPYVAGNTPTIADIFLFPQSINAERAGIELEQWPNIAEIMDRLRDIKAFAENAPAARR
ncbi:Maleylpyruvate isomerase [Cupriavidus campinensis]|jgi:maleylpyruvate isomerase|uniref:Maleylacetoacetate isomerase n=1 Tax=Cupriavidus campinensis TaxID=151783 RepID=A0AAE9I719_9BURK|nr:MULTISPECIES: maleylacetoacetate isomerase [Cupriavidus]TSP11208.1 maleylacetoacetate isomerase [Cupriavidus campinensis]URF07267.1 maleylacetoacetate isomerase [Cupriavidus campinensis]CAG2143427.1 Maleylpyruvate isomerase [Cupriavidus campinensis]